MVDSEKLFEERLRDTPEEARQPCLPDRIAVRVEQPILLSLAAR
jgi:hypothetical protein